MSAQGCSSLTRSIPPSIKTDRLGHCIPVLRDSPTVRSTQLSEGTTRSWYGLIHYVYRMRERCAVWRFNESAMFMSVVSYQEFRSTLW